ncbi:MAG: cell wall-binding repeat-containing protein [Actinomycetota bacterium]
MLVALATTAALAAPVVAQAQFPADTLAVVKEETGISNVEIAVALSQSTFAAPPSSVVVSRDDEFADALASGVMQADRPLLLVPTNGPIPPQVREEIERLDPAAAVVLGGTAAVSTAVEQELQAMGLTTDRRAGGSRIETAIAVAQAEAPEADTVILARAFGAAGATDPSQGFADTLAGGGMAAETGWPILLTATEALTPATRAYLEASPVRTVEILGGTAAISQAVEEELQAMGMVTERLAGDSRAGTAIAIADKLGAQTSADVDRVVLVQGQTPDAWAGGFAAGAHSAAFDAPIVLATGSQLPPATVEWLEAGAGGWAQDPQGIRITCVTVPSVCEQARLALGLPPAEGGGITFDPPAGSTVDAAQPITATLAASVGDVDEVFVTGTCLGPDNTFDAIRTDGVGPIPGDVLTLAVSGAVPAGPCEFEIEVNPVEGDRQTTTVTFTVSGRNRNDLLSTGPDGVGVGGRDPSTNAGGSVVAFTSEGRVLADVPDGTHHVYAWIDGQIELVDVTPSGSPGVAPCSNCSSPTLAVAADGGSVVFTSPDETLDPAGPVDFSSGSGGYLRNLRNGTTTFVSYDSEGTPIDVNEVDINGDGSVVTYQGQGRAPSPTTTSGFTTGFFTFWRDMTTGEVGAVADPATGEPIITGSSLRSELSADGRWIAFDVQEALVPADTNTGHDTYVFDRQTGNLEVVSVGPDGTAGDTEEINGEDFRGISGDGRYVAFGNGSTDLIDSEVVPSGAVYLRDREAGTTTLLSRRPDGSPALNRGGGRVRVSDDGSYVAFVQSEDLVNHDEAGCGVYRYTIATGELLRADLGEVEHGAANCPYGIDVADSGHVVFDEISTHHLHANPDNEAEVYRWNPS